MTRRSIFKAAIRVGPSYIALSLLLVSAAFSMAPGELVERPGSAPAHEESRAGAASLAPTEADGGRAEVKSYIIAGSSVETVAERVEDVGGKVTHELGIIRAVAADLTPKQLESLKKGEPELKIRDNLRSKLRGPMR